MQENGGARFLKKNYYVCASKYIIISGSPGKNYKY